MHVPLHQRTAPADELGIGERHPAGREHRRDQRPLVTVDLVDERLGLVRIEERVVADVGGVDVVLEPAGGVADRREPEGADLGDVGELREVLQRGGDERLGAGLLLGGHPGHAGEVDRLGRVERPRPRRRVDGVDVAGISASPRASRRGRGRPRRGCGRAWRR